MKTPTDYQVHMLRIWQPSPENDQDKSKLRVTLENTKTAIHVNFNDFESLVDYLKQQVETPVIS